MKKFLIAGCSLLINMSAFAAAPDYTTTSQTGRVGIQVNRVGAVGRPTIPVTTTTTTNTHVPETNITTESSSTVNVDIDGAKAACLMTVGNVWANQIYANVDGTPAGYALDPSPVAEDNVCFSMVSVKSGEIKNMGRFFPPRYFKTGSTVACGSWLDEVALDEAILDAKKSTRVAGTIAAAVGGAAVGVTLTEILGRQFGQKIGFQGQYHLEDEALLRSQLIVLKKENPAAFGEYSTELNSLKTDCDDLGDARADVAECQSIDQIATFINEINKNG